MKIRQALGALALSVVVLAAGLAPRAAAYDPHPGGYSSYAAGVDLSAHNAGDPTMRGLSFVALRATYGTWPDTLFPKHSRAAQVAGVATCAYHFGIASQDPYRQAEAFLQVALAQRARCLALDVESDPAGRMTDAQARAFIQAIHAAGLQVGLYESASGFDSFGQDWNWVAQWGPYQPRGAWAFWQWQGYPLDRDVFHGSPSLFKPWLETHLRLVPAGRIAVSSVAQVAPTLVWARAQEATLARYIANLKAVPAPSVLQQRELGTYRARLAVIRADIAYLTGIQTVERYIANLKAVRRPTAAQKAKLALYQARLAGWLANPRVL